MTLTEFVLSLSLEISHGKRKRHENDSPSFSIIDEEVKYETAKKLAPVSWSCRSRFGLHAFYDL
jgi:hypothetical protein